MTAVKRYGIRPTMVQRWRSRQAYTEVQMGRKEPRSTVLSAKVEVMVMAFRRHSRIVGGHP